MASMDCTHCCLQSIFYDFKICNAMITNFHMPESTLLMMTAAFGGFDLTMEAYKKAIKDKYRFFSYGDAMIVV